LRIEESSSLDVDSPNFSVLEQSSNRGKGIAMSRSSDLSKAPEYVIENSGRAIFGRLPLIRGESGCAYDELCARIAASVKPKDFIEEIWVRDIADLSWEVFRLRRVKAKLWTSQMAIAIRSALQGVCGEAEAKKLSRQWETGAIDQIDQLTPTIEAITADAFLAKSEEFERLDRTIMKAEARRNAALREVERRRFSMAQALRRASDDVVDAEFVDVAPDQIARKEVKVADTR
jgi:hypothetical protein